VRHHRNANLRQFAYNVNNFDTPFEFQSVSVSFPNYPDGIRNG
jgi:hypothetical protein